MVWNEIKRIYHVVCLGIVVFKESSTITYILCMTVLQKERNGEFTTAHFEIVYLMHFKVNCVICAPRSKVIFPKVYS